MILLGDYHTHTTFSHGTGSVLQNALVAKEKGLKQIAISDHGFGHIMYGMKPDKMDKLRLEIEQAKKQTGVDILLGIEANFISLDGTIDLKKEQLEWFDIILTGFHYAAKPKTFGDAFKFFVPNYSPFKPTQKTIQKNTEAIMRALDKYPIDVVTHPGYAMAVDFERLAKHCKQTNTYFEMNGKRINFTDEDLLKMQDIGTKFIINSDAHSPERVGECNHALNMCTRLDINKNLLVNVDKLPKFKQKG